MESFSSDDESTSLYMIEPASESAERTSIGETPFSASDPHADVSYSAAAVRSIFETMAVDRSFANRSSQGDGRGPLHLQAIHNRTDHDRRMCSTPQNSMGPLSAAVSELSLASMLTTSSMRAQLLKGSSIKSAFSPKSRRGIIDSARSVGSMKNPEPVFYNVLFTSCSERSSVVDLSRCVVKSQPRSRMLDTLELGDRVLIEFKGGFVLEDGSSIAILEGTVATTSKGSKRVAVLEHESVNFSLHGGAIAVNVFLVNRLFFEKKYHQLAITDLKEMRVECTLRVVQGPPKGAKISYIFNRIRESIPANSRVLIIGEQVRERVTLSSFCNFLNLQNLRLSLERSFGSEEQAENVRIFRACHLEYRDEIQKLQMQLEQACAEFSAKMIQPDQKTSRMQEIQDTVRRLEALKDLLSATDRNLALEAFADVTVIYGTVEDVSKTNSLLTQLAPAVTVVLDAESLTRAQLGTVFGVRKNHVYLACDTPFFWDAVTELKVKEKSNFLRHNKEPVSSNFINHLESFIDTNKIDFHFVSSRENVQNKGLSLLLTCFKYDFPKVVTRAQSPNNVVLIRHSLKDEAAVRFELNFIADLRRFFIMRGDHDHFGVLIDADGNLEEVRTGNQNRVKLPGIANENRLYGKHSQTLVSLHNLTAGTLPNLYQILKCTTREFFMVGNITQLRKTDECVNRFLSNVIDAGLVRKNVVYTCPKHQCDVLLGEGKEQESHSGCQEICNVPRSCGHPCAQKCHFHDDQTFDETWAPCRERCKKILPCHHPCPYTCGQPCIDRCQERVFVTLRCGHSVPVECWERDSSEVFCPKQKCQKKYGSDKMNTTGSVTSHSFFSRMRHPF